MYCLSCTARLQRMFAAVFVEHLTQSIVECMSNCAIKKKNMYFHSMEGNGEVFMHISVQKFVFNARLRILSFVVHVLRGLTGGQTSLSAHRLVTFERYENDFVCMTPGCSYSYSIKPMNKPSVCFPADKVIAIDLWATHETIMKSVCCLTMNVEQYVCLFARKKTNRWLYQWNWTEGDKTIIAEPKG